MRKGLLLVVVLGLSLRAEAREITLDDVEQALRHQLLTHEAKVVEGNNRGKVTLFELLPLCLALEDEKGIGSSQRVYGLEFLAWNANGIKAVSLQLADGSRKNLYFQNFTGLEKAGSSLVLPNGSTVVAGAPKIDIPDSLRPPNSQLLAFAIIPWPSEGRVVKVTVTDRFGNIAEGTVPLSGDKFKCPDESI